MAVHERLATAAFLLLLGLHWLAGPLSMPLQLALLVVAIVAAMPHGGADLPAAAALLKPRLGRAWLPLFLIGYLLTAAAVLLLWWASPAAALALFLALSAIHFGSTDAGASGVRGAAGVIAFGLAPLAITAAAHQDELAALFALLAGDKGARVAAVLAGVGLATFAVATSLVASRCLRAADMRPLGSLALGAGMFALLPPLAAFALYFGLLHAPRATRESAGRLGLRSGALTRAALPASLAALLFLAAGYLLLRQAGGADEALVRTSFIGLAALTVPHMAWAALSARMGANRPAAAHAHDPADASDVAVGARSGPGVLRFPIP